MTDLVQVGDTIVVDTGLGVHHYPVTRVTKTLALSLRESDGYEHRFQRVISSDMNYPKVKWNQQRFRVIRGNQ